jgi:diguanylate cyclase (GGDEF)-like protein/PAS domain S-box-containing protein
MRDNAIVEDRNLKLVRGAISRATELQQDEDCLELLRQAIDCLPIATGITITDIRGKILYANAVEARIHGYTQAELIGKDRRMLACGWDVAAGGHLAGGYRQQEGEDVRKSGDRFPVQLTSVPVLNQKGRVIGIITACEDLSGRKQSEQQIENLAFYDTVTSLPNRTLLMERLRHGIALAHRDGRQLALLFLDLDDFKHLNETQGHGSGDRLLQEVAARLTGCLGASGTIARVGGDEFVILLNSISHGDTAAVTAREVQVAFERPFYLNGGEFHCSSSIGIAVYPEDGSDAETLLRSADAAMYHAKKEGKSNFQFFSRELNDLIIRRVALENSMRSGISRGEFFLNYQPQWDLRAGRVTGVEALLRWQSADLGRVSPDEFIPIAESSGLILELGEMVLRTACLQAKAWSRQYGNLTVAVNISGRQFKQPDFLDTVAGIIAETGVDPRLLELELTESVIMEKAEKNIDSLCAIKKMGVQLSIDDFGTGYSSLNYLKHFPIDTIKIDRTFITDVDTNRDDAAITEAILSMAHSLKLRVVAEGVENLAQLQFLTEKQCDGAQGYFLATPMPAEDVAGYLQRAQAKRELFCHASGPEGTGSVRCLSPLAGEPEWVSDSFEVPTHA